MKKLFAVFDLKARAYGPIMGYAHEAQAIRDFGQACNDPQSMLSKYPQDFQLREIGEFYDNGESKDRYDLDAIEPRVVITADALLAAQSSGPKLAQEA